LTSSITDLSAKNTLSSSLIDWQCSSYCVCLSTWTCAFPDDPESAFCRRGLGRHCRRGLNQLVSLDLRLYTQRPGITVWASSSSRWLKQPSDWFEIRSAVVICLQGKRSSTSWQQGQFLT